MLQLTRIKISIGVNPTIVCELIRKYLLKESGNNCGVEFCSFPLYGHILDRFLRFVNISMKNWNLAPETVCFEFENF